MIHISGLTFLYDEHLVLDQISLDFGNAGLYGILGPNGAGKSTLLKNIGGILSVDNNTIRIDGKDINKYSKKKLAQKVAYVPQQFSPVYAFTVMQLLEMGRFPYHGLFDELTIKEREIIDYAVQVTGLTELKDHFITELSGGELQRVMIARALVQDTPIIILDEPISHLDIHYQKEIIQLLKMISKKKNKVIITVLHDMNVGLNYCDYVHLLSNRKVISGKPGDVLTLDQMKQTYQVDLIKVEHDDKQFIHW